MNQPHAVNVTADIPLAPADHPVRSIIDSGVASSPTRTAVAPATTERYTFGGEIARGGMGIIYRATDTVLGREVAVKVLHEKYDPESGAALRFAGEARITGQLQHPSIPPVHDMGTLADGRPFLAMKLIKGQNLEELLKQTPSPQPLSPGVPGERGRFVAVFEQVCQALAYAHAHDVIHRDLKPANVMVGAFGEVQVMDWGLAKVLGAASAHASPTEGANESTWAWTQIYPTPDTGSYTQAGSVLGTPAFAPPEQALGEIEKVGPRSDVFGLGAILAVILTGKPPYVGETAESVRVQAARGKLDDCFARLDGCGAEPELVALCHRCLAFEPADRPENAGVVAQAVAELRAAADERARRAELEQVRVEGEKATAEAREAEQRKRRKVQLALAAAVLVVLITGVVVSGVLAVNAFRSTALAESKAAEAKESEQRADQQRREAVSNLYSSLVGEARALRLARVNGYRAKAWERLQDALKLDTPMRNVEELRQEALACMGDFTGLEPTSLTGFKATVGAIAIHPQGSALAVGLGDGTMVIKSLPAGADVARLGEHGAPVTALAFGPDGNKLVSADDGGTVKVWEPDLAGAWACRKSIGAGSYVSSLALTPDGAQVAVCCPGTAAIGLWSLTDGTRVAAFNAGEGDLVGSMALSADGRLLASSYYGKDADSRGILVWNVATRQPKARREWPLRLTRLGRVYSMAFSADSKLLACSANGIIVLGTDDYQEQMVARLDEVIGISFSPDNRMLALASQSGVVRLWDVVVGRGVAVLNHAAGRVAFSANGQVLVSASGDSIKIWKSAATPEKLTLLGHAGGEVTGVAFSPDGKMLASSGGHDSTVVLWDTSTGRRIRGFPAAVYYTQSVAFSPDGRILATAERGMRAGEIEFWDVATGEKLLALHHGLGGETVAFSPNGGYVAACGRQGVTLWRVERNRPAAVVPKPLLKLTEVYQARLAAGNLVAVHFSPDSKLLACALDDGTLHICDVENRRPCLSPPARLGRGLQNGAFFPDGKHLIVGAATPEVWNVATGEKVASFGPAQYVWGSTVLSRDGRRLVVRSPPSALEVWEVTTQKLLISLPEERMHVWSHALSPDGEHLAVGLSDGELAIWNLDQVRAQLDEIGLGWKEQRPAPESLVFPKEDPDAASSAARRHEDGQSHLRHGVLLAGKMRFAEAELSCGRAAVILEELVAECPGVLEYRQSLAVAQSRREVFAHMNRAIVILRDKKDVEGAIREYNEALRIDPNDDVVHSPQLAGLVAEIGLKLLSQKKWTQAEPLLRECLAIREKTQPDVWNTFNAKSMLGGSLLGQKKYAEAEPLLLAGYEGMKQRETTIPEQAKIRLAEALDRLIELSTVTNNPDDVKKWQAERAKYPQKEAPKSGEKK